MLLKSKLAIETVSTSSAKTENLLNPILAEIEILILSDLSRDSALYVSFNRLNSFGKSLVKLEFCGSRGFLISPMV